VFKRDYGKCIFLFLITIFIMLCFIDQAQAEQAGDYTYTITDDKATITKYTGTGQAVIQLPSTLGGKTVIAIGQNAFYSCSALTDITINSGITRIDRSAFQYCSNLKTLNLPEGLTTVDTLAFADCGKLTGVILPNTITSLGNSVFRNCKSMTSFIIPPHLTSISSGMLYSCSGLTSITIPAGVTTIGSEAFEYCTSLTSITLPSTVTSIGQGAFSACTSLTTLNIPDGVTNIGSYAFAQCKFTGITLPANLIVINDGVFKWCTTLTGIVIPDGVTSIGTSAFDGCPLTSIHIPQRLTSIGGSAFSGCPLTDITVDANNPSYEFANNMLYDKIKHTLVLSSINLSAIIFPSGVTAIGDGCFMGRTGLSNVTIPQGVTSIGNDAFNGCTGLKSVVLPTGITSLGRYAFNDCTSLSTINLPEDLTNLSHHTFKGCSSLTSITIPHGIISLGEGIFANCTSLTSVTLPQGISGLGSYFCEGVFINCTKLSSINLPSSLTLIGESAFAYCTSLTHLTIPDNVDYICYSAFQDCTGLTSIILPASVGHLDEQAFASCSGLTQIVFQSPNTIISDHANTIPPSTVINGYSQSTAQTYANKYNRSFATIDTSEYTESDYKYKVVGNEAEICKYTGSASDVVIPGTLQGYPVTRIGSGAFSWNSTLDSITVPNSVRSIGNEAFSNCRNLTSVNLPLGLSSIGGWAFELTGLTSISIPESLTSMGSLPFFGCPLNNITVDQYNSSYTSIDGVLYNKARTTLMLCPSGITSINIPSGVKSIANYAFYNCSGLGNINLPSTVTSIGSSAFLDCSGLTSITIPSGVSGIYQGVFGSCTGLNSITFKSDKTTIYDSTSTIPASATIIGYNPSAARDYAVKYNRTFILIGNALESICITHPAKKLNYVVGEQLDSTGLVVTGTYDDGSTRIQDLSTANTTGFDSKAPATDQVLTIIIGGLKTTYTVQIVSKAEGSNWLAQAIAEKIKTDQHFNQYFNTLCSNNNIYLSFKSGAGDSNLADSFDILSLMALLIQLENEQGCTLDSILIKPGASFSRSDMVSNATATYQALQQAIVELADATGTPYIQLQLKQLVDKTITVSMTGGQVINLTLKPEDECFIATAAFGSKFAWPVALLRHFRDQYLLTNHWGTAFVEFYYRNSPPIAATIAGNRPLKVLVRILLAPVVAVVYLVYHPMISTALLLIIILLLVYRRKDARVISRV